MARIREKTALSIDEAMENVSAMAAIDFDYPPPLGLIRGVKLVFDPNEAGQAPWLPEEGEGPLLPALDQTWNTLRDQVDSLAVEDKEGLRSLQALVGEAAVRMEKYLVYKMGRPPETKISSRPSYLALKEMLESKAAKPEEETGDFEEVKQDLNYELFYLQKEDGAPYFNEDVLRHIKLACDFEGGESFEEDPLLRVRAMEDRDLHASAGQVLGECDALLVDFYKTARKLEENQLAQMLGMAATALFLAGNPRNLVQNTAGKSCLQYFQDFHTFLRAALQTAEYQKWIAYPPEQSDRPAQLLLQLAHGLCRALFCRPGGIRQEAIGLIHRTMRRGEEQKRGRLKGESIWSQLSVDDENFRTLLAHFPNGPLFKILDLLREGGEETIGFDPIKQGNLPHRLYRIEQKDKTIEVLRVPSPTRQQAAPKAEIVEEFRGFLRACLGDRHPQKLLLINLQDRTSWKEFSRCTALEGMQRNAEFSSQLAVATLPKSTDFYSQSQEYLDIDGADLFIASLKAQMEDPESCGFFFPPQWKKGDRDAFTAVTASAIHEIFFRGAKTLARQEREDFIEIFYQILVLKLIDCLDAGILGFTCKDGVDTSATESALFFTFVQLLSGGLDKREEQDFLRWLLYAPALFIRERAVNPERLNRALSAMQRISDASLSESQKAQLYQSKGLRVLL